MTVVAIFAGFGIVLAGMGVWGRRNAAEIGVVPGMPEELVEHRITVLRRGATVCAVVGAMFLILAVAAPFI
jgi:hypothetical protein